MPRGCTIKNRNPEKKPTRPVRSRAKSKIRHPVAAPTYQPVQTVTDWLDYQAYFRTFPHPADNLGSDGCVSIHVSRHQRNLRHIYDNYRKGRPHPRIWGPFIPQEGEVSASSSGVRQNQRQNDRSEKSMNFFVRSHDMDHGLDLFKLSPRHTAVCAATRVYYFTSQKSNGRKSAF